MNGEIMLSHWWRTESCRQAFAQAEAKRTERLARVRAEVAERKAKLIRDVEEMEVQQ